MDRSRNTLLRCSLQRFSTSIFARWSFMCRTRHGFPRSLNIIFLRSSMNGVYPPLSCKRSPLTLGNDSVKPKSTWTLLKPHFENLVSTFVFAQLSFNDTKKELWENDPVDYIRVSVGTYTHMYADRKITFFTRRIRGLRYTRIGSHYLPILTDCEPN